MGSERIHGWLKCCRLCLMDDGVKMPIFGEEGIHREVAKKIESCLPIVIYNSDPLSKLICQRCLFMLDTVYDFHQKCVQTTVVLTNQLLAVKNSSAVTVYLLTLEKNDLLACSSTGKDPKRKHPTPDQIPVEEVIAMDTPEPRETRSADFSAVRVKQEVPQIVNVVGSYSGELRRRSQTPGSLSEGTPPIAPSEIKREPGVGKPFKKVTPWYCKFCNKYYKNRGTLYKHRKYFCSKKGFECPKCSRVFAVETDKLVHLADHLRVHASATEEQLASCPRCDKRFLSRVMLENHARTHRPAPVVPAPVPARDPDSESDPSETLSSECRFPCEFCPRTYVQRGKLNRHKSEEHRGQMFPDLVRSVSPPAAEDPPPSPVALPYRHFDRPSPLSKKKLANPTTLLRQLLLKQQGPVPKCHLCDKPFESRGGLANHMRIHLPKYRKVSPKCLDCGKMFGSREGLRYHTNKFHRGLVQNKHHCRPCNTSFPSRSQWLLHMVSHSKPTPSPSPSPSPPRPTPPTTAPTTLPSCIYCDQEFDEVAELTAHLSSVHGLGRHFPCKVCFKLFAHRSNMARHMKIHQRGNHQYTLHPCHVCGKKFLSRETADKHAAMHAPSQTFHCPLCNKIFFKMEGLENHACNPGGQSDQDCPSCNFPYAKGHECQYREDGSRIVFFGNAPGPRASKKKKKSSQHRSGRTYKCKHCMATFASCYSHNSHMKIHTSAYRARNNVILTVPSPAQARFVEVKAEPVDPSFEPPISEPPPSENGFAWMRPDNLAAGDRPGDEASIEGATLQGEDTAGISLDQSIGIPRETESVGTPLGHSDPGEARPLETTGVDETSPREPPDEGGGITEVAPREPEPVHEISPGSDENIVPTSALSDLNRGETDVTEMCPETSSPFTGNHSQEIASSYLSYSASSETNRDEEVYDCNICGKAFSTPEELTTHVRWHGDPKKMPFKCPFCERGFVNSPSVYQHVLMNHKEQRY